MVDCGLRAGAAVVLRLVCGIGPSDFTKATLRHSQVEGGLGTDHRVHINLPTQTSPDGAAGFAEVQEVLAMEATFVKFAFFALIALAILGLLTMATVAIVFWLRIVWLWLRVHVRTAKPEHV